MALVTNSMDRSPDDGMRSRWYPSRPSSWWWIGAFAAILLATAAIPTAGQVSVTTYQYNNQRTGVNGNETILTPSNVNSTNFGELFTYPVDGDIYGQPLYMPNVTINGAVHNVVYVATENDSVYAFDADSNVGSNAEPLWQTSFLSPGVTTVSDNYCTDITPEYGVTGTPVIDPSTNTLYVVAETLEDGGTSYVKRLHALDITTGAEKPGSPIVITALVTVSGQSTVTFDTLWENQRAGLLFYNGVVYIAFGAHCDGGDWRGWILGYSYNGSALTQVFVFSTEPSSVNGAGGGIWMSGQGLPMDTGSNLFVGIGNGQFDTNITPPINYGDSILRMDLSQGPTVQDYFTPSIQATLDSQNQDLGSGGIAILPDQPGPYPHLAVTADKYQTIYVVNRDNLGKFNSSSDNVVQELSFGSARMFSSPIYFNGKVYFSGTNDVVRAYTMSDGLLSTSSTDQAGDIFKYPGSVPTISANGTSNAILWTLESAAFSTSGPAVLYAYDPTNLSAGSLYNSNQNVSRDSPGGAIKFAVPTVVNGKVYVGAAGQLSVYGELAGSAGASAITSANSTTFTVGTAGSFTVTTTGTPTPSLSETGALPSGVTFNNNGNGTATLSGTPAAGTAGSYPLTITASNGVGTPASQGFILTVNGGVTGTAPSITSANSTTFTVGTAGSFTVTTTGTPTPSLSETGALPSGVTFNNNGNGTATLSGTPASGTGGTYPLTITASNGVGTPASQSFTLTISSGSASWGQMDAWLQMNTSTPGTTLTTSILAAGTLGGDLTANNFGETGDAGTPSGNADIVLATPFVTGSDARGYTPVSVSGYNWGVSTTANFDLGIYADSSGSPGSLLCHTGTTSLTPGNWNFITLSLSSLGCPTLSANTQYWSAYITSSNSIGQSYVSGDCPGTSLASVKASSAQGSALLPSSFGANTPFSSECYSLYVTASDNTGSMTWSLSPSTPTGFTVATSQGSMGGSITVNGTLYANGTTTQSLALNNGASTPIFVATNSAFKTASGASIPTVVANGYLTPGPANAGTNGVDFALVNLIAQNGDYVILQLNNGDANGSGTCYCVRVETNGGSGRSNIYSSTIPLTPGHRYSYSLLFDETGGTAKAAIYDPSNGFAQVGSTVTVAQTTGGIFGEWQLGNTERGESSGNTTYLEDPMLDWTNHTFPNYPGGESAPSITSTNSTTFTVGTAGSFTVTTTGTPTPSLSETGALPSGVTFNNNGNGTATLSGTPASGTGGTYPLTITASNGVGTPASQGFTLTVNGGVTGTAPSITSANSTTFTVGTAGSFTVTTTGTPTPSLSETGALPSGVTFNNNGNGTATLSGTPASGTGGTYPLTITASNGVGTPASQGFTLTVNQAPAITSANSTTFTVGTAGSFTVTTTGTPTPSLSETGALPSGVTFNNNGNGTATLSGTPASGTGGTYPLTITASNGVGTPASQGFTLTVNQAPAITSANSTTFTVGTAGSFTVTTTGTPTPSLSETGALPSGVTFNNNGNGTATLSGTPAAGTAGSYPLTITASNGVGTPASQGFILTVNGGVTGTAPSITSANSTTFTVGTAGSFTVTTTGTPTPSLSETGALPSGVTFNNNGNGTATLSGTPASGTGGTYPLTITASNGVGTPASQSFTLTISSGSASWGQMDAWLQMNTSTPGTTLTTSILAAGTLGGDLTANNFGETGDAGTPSGNADIVLATPFVTGSDARGYTPVSVSGYNWGVSTTANFDLGIYADSSGSPGSLLCHTGTTSLTPGNWNFITLSLSSLGCPTLSANTQYWSAYITSSNSIGQSYVSGDCPGTSLASVKASSAQGSALLPSSFGANTPFSSECYSLYVTASDNTGSMTWSLSPSTPTGFTVATSQGSMGGSITVNGTLYANGTTTQSLALNNGASTPIFVATNSAFKTASGASIPTVVANGYLTPGPANAGTNGVDFALVNLIAQNGDYVILQLNNGDANGSGTCYCVRVETNGGSGRSNIYSSTIPLTPGHRYSYSLLFDETGGTAKAAIYDPSNGFAQVGSTVTVAQTTGGIFGEWQLGNTERGESSGNTTYLEDPMLDWTNHTFPNYPH